MKKILVSILMFFMVLLMFAQTPTSTNKMLWCVSGNGLAKPTYILGSHHIAPASMIDSIPGLRDAMAQADVVYGEIAKDELNSPATVQKMMTMAKAPADSTLLKVLTPAQQTSVDSLLTLYMGPGMFSMLAQMKPALITAQLTMILTQQAFPDMEVGNVFDACVMGEVEKLGKPVRGLENAEYQMDVLFGSSIRQQADDLMRTVSKSATMPEYVKNLAAAYRAQDLNELWRLMNEGDDADSEADMERLLYSRNEIWADRLPQLMQEGSLLVVVGAGHLPGDRGLLKLLRDKGYTVE